MADSAEPRAKVGPDKMGNGDSEALKDSLSNEADLNVTVIGGELASNSVTIA